VSIGTGSVLARLTIAGATADNTAYAFKADNLAATNLLSVRNDGFLQVGEFSGNYIYYDPTITFPGYEVRITDGVDYSQFLMQPNQINMSNPSGQLLITGGEMQLYGVNRIAILSSIINAVLIPVGNAGLASGDLYVDTAANVLANGDYVLARKA
jgi:hypothetical protein